MSLVKECDKLTGELKDYFNNNIKTIAVIGKGNISEVAIQTPFLLNDRTKLELRLREENGSIILHDNSIIYQYLLSQDVSIFSKSDRHEKYNYFIEKSMKRNNFQYNKNWRFFYIDPQNKATEEIFRFADSLQKMSCLTLTKNLRNSPKR